LVGIQHASATIQQGSARILFALEVTDGDAAAAQYGGTGIRGDGEAAEFGVAEFRRDAKAIVRASSWSGAEVYRLASVRSGLTSMKSQFASIDCRLEAEASESQAKISRLAASPKSPCSPRNRLSARSSGFISCRCKLNADESEFDAGGSIFASPFGRPEAVPRRSSAHGGVFATRAQFRIRRSHGAAGWFQMGSEVSWL